MTVPLTSSCSNQNLILQFLSHVYATNSHLLRCFLFFYLFTISHLYICIIPFSSFPPPVWNLCSIPLAHKYKLLKALNMRNSFLWKFRKREFNLGKERGSGCKGWSTLPNQNLQRCGPRQWSNKVPEHLSYSRLEWVSLACRDWVPGKILWRPVLLWEWRNQSQGNEDLGPGIWFTALDMHAFMVWKHARCALSRPDHDLYKIISIIWKGLTFRNSFWYAARHSNSYSDYTLIGTLYSTHKKTHHKQKLFFSELCEVKVSGSCVNYMFMEHVGELSQGPFLLLKALYI